MVYSFSECSFQKITSFLWSKCTVHRTKIPAWKGKLILCKNSQCGAFGWWVGTHATRPFSYFNLVKAGLTFLTTHRHQLCSYPYSNKVFFLVKSYQWHPHQIQLYILIVKCTELFMAVWKSKEWHRKIEEIYSHMLKLDNFSLWNLSVYWTNTKCCGHLRVFTYPKGFYFLPCQWSRVLNI